MRSRIIAIAAALLVGGLTVATAQPPGPGAKRSDADAPSIRPSEPGAQNPLVNPNAAGTQTRWRGYGASSGATGTAPSAAGSAAPAPAGQPLNEAQAYQRLEQLGYSRISELHQGKSGWQATAQRGKRAVQVQLNAAGNVVGERQAAR